MHSETERRDIASCRFFYASFVSEFAELVDLKLILILHIFYALL